MKALYKLRTKNKSKQKIVKILKLIKKAFVCIYFTQFSAIGIASGMLHNTVLPVYKPFFKRKQNFNYSRKSLCYQLSLGRNAKHMFSC